MERERQGETGKERERERLGEGETGKGRDRERERQGERETGFGSERNWLQFPSLSASFPQLLDFWTFSFLV